METGLAVLRSLNFCGALVDIYIWVLGPLKAETAGRPSPFSPKRPRLITLDRFDGPRFSPELETVGADTAHGNGGPSRSKTRASGLPARSGSVR